MRPVLKTIASVAGTSATVLLLGESGVGKEVVAHALHDVPPRASHPFLKVNCAALPGDLLESELFGHDKGAFTGAYREKPGKFELARHGTIMLDEIGEVPLHLQAKLLQVLQDGAFARVGGTRMIHSDARVVAATNRNLEAAIRARQFREDLFYRLNVISIRVPPLRERREEIPQLADHFLRRFNAAYGRASVISPAVMRAFTNHSWPGNVRELENAIKRMVVLGPALPGHPTPAWSAATGIPAATSSGAAAPLPVAAVPTGLRTIAREAARAAERAAIETALASVDGNRGKAAELLQISYATLCHKIARCGLTRRRSPTAGSIT
jgi:two-component system response regulator AtoC